MSPAPPGTAAPSWALEIRGLTKHFGLRPALRGIDLQIQRGSFVTVFGPNGAGKTTLIRILATLCRPSGGRVLVQGLSLAREPAALRRTLGVVLHQPLLYEELTAHENLRFYGRMYDVPDLDRRIDLVLRRVGLSDRRDDHVGTLSHGMQRRLSIGRAILHRPSILLLDEPETGLDQHALSLLEEVLAEARSAGRTVIMTTHDLRWGLKKGERVIILADGRVVFDASKPVAEPAAIESAYEEFVARGARVS